MRLGRKGFRFLATIFYLAVFIVVAEASAFSYVAYKMYRNNHFVEQVVFMASVREGAGDSLWHIKWQEYTPGASKKIKVGDQLYTIKISRDGFRTKDIYPKKPGTFRILAIGGSTTVQGNSNETTWPAYLEKVLLEKYPDSKIEVFNLGISGTDSGYWLKRLDKLIAMEPDLVIQYNAINDIANSNYYSGYYEQHPVRGFFRGRVLYQLLYPPDPSEFQPVYEHIIGNMIELNDRLGSHGIKYVTATFASPDPENLDNDFLWFLNFGVALHWGKAAKIFFYKDFVHMLDAYNLQLMEAMDKHGIAVVQLHKQIYERTDFIDVCHMTDSGIQKQARAFLPAVATSVFELPYQPVSRAQ